MTHYLCGLLQTEAEEGTGWENALARKREPQIRIFRTPKCRIHGLDTFPPCPIDGSTRACGAWIAHGLRMDCAWIAHGYPLTYTEYMAEWVK